MAQAPSPPDFKLSSELPERGALAVVDVRDGFVLVVAEIEGGTRVQGTVRDASGELVADAEVWVVRDRGRTAFAVATTARDGTFSADDLDAGTALFACSASHASSRSVEITSDNSQAIELVLGAQAAEVVGVIADAAGRPIAGARVRIGDPDEDDSRRVQVPSDAYGAFRVPAPALGRVAILVLAPGFQPWLGDVEVTESPRDPLRITLSSGAVIAGVVRGPDGEPREGLLVRAHAEGQPDTDVRSGSGGAFRLECLAPGALWLTVDETDDHRGANASAIGVLGVEQHIDLSLGRWGRLSGLVVDAAGQPLAKARVFAVPVDDPDARTIDDRTDDAGAFELRTHPDRRYRLEVAPERADQMDFTLHRARGSATLAFLLVEASGEPSVAGHRRVRCDWLGDLAADRADVEVRLPVNCVPSARLVMRLLDPDARPLAAALVVHVDGATRSVRPGEDGRIELGPLVPGEYRFEVRPDDDALAPFDLTVRALGVNERVDLGDVYAKRKG
ncbi:MAG: carboxypeptidase regulatory-like domain-containing protein [Planctomycetes bacterium]|nr:carboxypeptidase regulatory-like domain-containing protein [Planctomycetota bacterium]